MVPKGGKYVSMVLSVEFGGYQPLSIGGPQL